MVCNSPPPELRDFRPALTPVRMPRGSGTLPLRVKPSAGCRRPMTLMAGQRRVVQRSGRTAATSIRLRFARQSRARRGPRFRDTSRCFRALYDRGAAARLAGLLRRQISVCLVRRIECVPYPAGSRPISLTHPSTMRAYCRVPRCGDACNALGHDRCRRPTVRLQLAGLGSSLTSASWGTRESSNSSAATRRPPY